MKLQTLVTTVDRRDFSFLEKMNLQGDVLVSNQADREGDETFAGGSFSARIITVGDRGVSRARNRLIEESEAEILLFADDDIIFEDGYAAAVIDEFKSFPEADAIKFGYISADGEEFTYAAPEKTVRAGKRDLMSTGVPVFAVKRMALERTGVRFDETLGPGGGGIEAGEDSLFFAALFKAKLKIFRSDKVIAKLENGKSVWFSGIEEKFLLSKGYIYKRLYGGLAVFAAARFAFRCRDREKRNGYTRTGIFRTIMRGTKNKLN